MTVENVHTKRQMEKGVSQGTSPKNREKEIESFFEHAVTLSKEAQDLLVSQK